jgi:hypothetical protein
MLGNRQLLLIESGEQCCKRLPCQVGVSSSSSSQEDMHDAWGGV